MYEVMGCFEGLRNRLKGRQTPKSDDKVAAKTKAKWTKPKVSLEHEQFQAKDGGCSYQVPVEPLMVPSRPPTRTSVIAVKFLLNGNSQRDAKKRRAALLKEKLEALEAQNLKREECQRRKAELDKEFRNNAIRTRRLKEARQERAISRLAESRMSVRVTPTDEEMFDSPPASACQTPEIRVDIEMEVDPHFNA